MNFSASTSPEKRIAAVNQLIQQLSADDRPILLGPWRSELGFEALYWLPFLRHLAGKVPNFKDRAAVVTRGGLAPLYRDVAASGYDLFALRSVVEVRRQNISDQLDTKVQKQVRETSWDTQALSDAARQLGFGSTYHTVHPAWMYWACGPFWEDIRGLKHLAAVTDYAPLAPVTLEGFPLPPRFAAVKFYARHTFPYPHPECAEFVQRTVSIVASQIPVVVLGSGSEFDDHADVPMAGPNIHHLPEVPPEQNLLLQAAVLSQASVFVGTYGGMAQLALRLGKPSVSVWAHFGGTAAAHLTLSHQIAAATGVSFVAGSLKDATLWRDVTGVHHPLAKTEQEGVAA